jgi:hypothetical protein
LNSQSPARSLDHSIVARHSCDPESIPHDLKDDDEYVSWSLGDSVGAVRDVLKSVIIGSVQQTVTRRCDISAVTMANKPCLE